MSPRAPPLAPATPSHCSEPKATSASTPNKSPNGLARSLTACSAASTPALNEFIREMRLSIATLEKSAKSKEQSFRVVRLNTWLGGGDSFLEEKMEDPDFARFACR